MSNKLKTSQQRSKRVHRNIARKALAKKVRKLFYENYQQARPDSEDLQRPDVPDETETA